MKERKLTDKHANQFSLDPRQLRCWESYITPDSETFGNAYKSAKKAGYEESYCLTITDTEWFKEKILRMNLLSKAEKVLNKALDYKTETDEGEVKTDLLRIQTDTAKHITKTLGKEHYNEKIEIDHTGQIEILEMDV